MLGEGGLRALLGSLHDLGFGGQAIEDLFLAVHGILACIEGRANREWLPCANAGSSQNHHAHIKTSMVQVIFFDRLV